MPFTTNYGVSFPEGQTITIGNTHIIVLSNQGLIITDIDGDRAEYGYGRKKDYLRTACTDHNSWGHYHS